MVRTLIIVIKKTKLIFIKKANFKFSLSGKRKKELKNIICLELEKEVSKKYYNKEELLYLFCTSCKDENERLTDFQKTVLKKIKRFTLNDQEVYKIFSSYAENILDNDKKVDEILGVLEEMKMK